MDPHFDSTGNRCHALNAFVATNDSTVAITNNSKCTKSLDFKPKLLAFALSVLFLE